MGDTIELEMHKRSPFDLNDSDFTVVKIFEFDNKLQRMSVIVKNEQTQSFSVLVKGSPEVLEELSDKHSVHSDFNAVLEKLFMKGYRILGLASKSVLSADLSREEAEKGLTF
jgi:magnesium-transporting ATPase (P-type)